MPHPQRVALITGCGKPIGIGNSTARALAAAGITVVVTDLQAAGVANEHNVQGDVETGFRERSKAIPVGRFGEPDEIASMIAYLASDAAAFVTGQAISVDGGW